MFNALRHLLPDSVAWRVIVERTLKKYLRGLSSAGTNAVGFVDDIYDDIGPDTTRELEEWEQQFDLYPLGSDTVRRQGLAAAWAARGGQSRKYLEDIIRASGFTLASVYESFDLSDVSLSLYSGDSKSITPEDVAPHGFCFAQGGRYLFTTGDNTAAIYRYTLSQPYTLSTAVLSGSFDTSGQDSGPFDVHVRDNGRTMFVLGADTDQVFEYSLSDPFDLSSTVTMEATATVSAQDSVPQGFAWKGDGTAFYIVGTANDNIHQFPLSTPWDIVTVSAPTTVSSGITNPTSISFNEAGTVMLMVGLGSSLVRQWNLATAWDITSATVGPTYDVAAVDGDPFHVVLEHNQIFVLDLGSTDIFRYSFGGPRDPRDYTNQPLVGTTQCGDDGSGINPVAQCGEEPPKQTNSDSAVCNRFLANDVLYLWNNNLTNTAPPAIPDDPTYWPHFWYVAGSSLSTPLALDEVDRQRFEKVLLKHGPTEQFIVTIVDRWQTNYISNWVYEDGSAVLDTGEWQLDDPNETPMLISALDSPEVPNVPDANLNTYAYYTGIASPVDQQIRFNNVNPENVTACYLGESDDASNNHAAQIEALAAGDWIRYTNTDGQYIEVQATQPPFDNGVYYLIAVENARATPTFAFPGDGTFGNVKLFPNGILPVVDQSVALSAIGADDRIRFELTDESWVEYTVVGPATDQGPQFSIPFNTTPADQSSDWSGFPSVGSLVNIYHRENL